MLKDARLIAPKDTNTTKKTPEKHHKASEYAAHVTVKDADT
jgi:hypothetical protein